MSYQTSFKMNKSLNDLIANQITVEEANLRNQQAALAEVTQGLELTAKEVEEIKAQTLQKLAEANAQVGYTTSPSPEQLTATRGMSAPDQGARSPLAKALSQAYAEFMGDRTEVSVADFVRFYIDLYAQFGVALTETQVYEMHPVLRAEGVQQAAWAYNGMLVNNVEGYKPNSKGEVRRTHASMHSGLIAPGVLAAWFAAEPIAEKARYGAFTTSNSGR